MNTDERALGYIEGYAAALQALQLAITGDSPCTKVCNLSEFESVREVTQLMLKEVTQLMIEDLREFGYSPPAEESQ